MSAVIATAAPSMGLTAREALWDYPLSAIMQMMHARGVSNGGDFDWVEAGEPDKDLLDQYEMMRSIPIEELIDNY